MGKLHLRKIFSQEWGRNSARKIANTGNGGARRPARADDNISLSFVLSPSPLPPLSPHVERCQGPVSCPSSCNLYRNIAAGRSCRLSGKERSRRDSRSLERCWRNVGRRKWVPDPGILDEDRAEPFVAAGPLRLPWKFPLGWCAYLLL